MKTKLILLTFLLLVGGWRAQGQGSNITSSGTTCATSNACAAANLNPGSTGSVTFTISGTFSATLQFEILADGAEANKSAVNCYPPNSTTAATSTTAAGTWTCGVPGAQVFRVRCSAYTSGTAVVVINVSNNVSLSSLTAGGGGGGGGAPTGPAGGDLSGTYPNPTVAQINGAAVPVSAKLLGSNSSQQAIAAALSSTHLYVGNSSNLPVDVALSGDCTMANTGAITCTKTSGTSFAPSATTDTTNATNISSGTLAVARLPTAIPIANIGSAGLSATLPLVIGLTGAINTTSITGFRYGTAGAADAAATAAQAATLIQGLTGCNTAGFVFTPQASDCVAVSGTGTVTNVSGAGLISTTNPTTTPVVACATCVGTGQANTYTTGAQDFTGATSTLVSTQTAGDSSTKAANTAFVTTAVNNAIAGVNPAVAVLAASTANVTGTYTSVGSGIGDTFTVTATGAFTLDGIAINTIGQRVLLKNQTDGTQNGIYTATVVGASLVSPVFTRALDYDQPSDVNNTGAIPVQSGTVNTTTSWLLTSNITSIGPAGSAFTYTQFSVNPTTIATGYSIPSGCDQNGGTWTNQTVVNTTTATTMVSCTIPASYVGLNQVLVVDASGILGTQASAGNFTIAITYGGATICTTPTQAITSSVSTPKSWTLHCEMQGTAAVGTSVAVYGTGNFVYGNAGTTSITWGMPNASTVTAVNTSASGTLALVATWGTASATNSITGQVFRLHREN